MLGSCSFFLFFFLFTLDSLCVLHSFPAAPFSPRDLGVFQRDARFGGGYARTGVYFNFQENNQTRRELNPTCLDIHPPLGSVVGKRKRSDKPPT